MTDVASQAALHVFLPWPTNVNVNHQYIKTRWGIRLSPQATAWRNTVIVLVRQEHVTFPPKLPLSFELVALCPDRRRHDLDGLIKGTQDSVCLALDIDDNRIMHLRAHKYLAMGNPAGLDVRLTLSDDEPWQ